MNLDSNGMFAWLSHRSRPTTSTKVGPRRRKDQLAAILLLKDSFEAIGWLYLFVYEHYGMVIHLFVNTCVPQNQTKGKVQT